MKGGRVGSMSKEKPPRIKIDANTEHVKSRESDVTNSGIAKTEKTGQMGGYLGVVVKSNCYTISV